MGDMAKYQIRSRANTPSRVFLLDPETNEKTEDWLDIVSSLSDAFRLAKDAAMQEAGAMSAERDDAKRKDAIDQVKRQMQAALVAGWSFDKPCTPEAVAAFLLEAPQVAMMVVSVADDNARFFKVALQA